MLRMMTTLLLILSASTSLAAENFKIRPVADHIYLVQGPVGNTVVAADTDGLILFDGVPAQYAREYLGFIKEETGVEDIKTLILSHWHAQVTGLNAILGQQGVEIIAHENTRQWLGSTIRERGETIIHTPLVEEQLPTLTFYWGQIEKPFRDDTIEIGYLLQAHTDGDLYALVRNANVLYTGPAIVTDGWATVDETTNGFIGGMTDAYATLGQIIDDNTVIVPISGPLLSKSEFDAQHSLYNGLKAEMVSLLRQSRSAEEVVIANPAQGLMPEWGDASEFLDEGFRSLYGHLRNGRQIGGGFP